MHRITRLRQLAGELLCETLEDPKLEGKEMIADAAVFADCASTLGKQFRAALVERGMVPPEDI